MKEDIIEEIQNNGSRKIVVGVRCYPELKLKLIKEAKELGITISEHAENILLNKDKLLGEKSILESEIDKLEKSLTETVEELDLCRKEYTESYKKLEEKNHELIKTNGELKDQVLLYNDKRLLELFSLVKGKKDTISLANGQSFIVHYNSPKDLLHAMIYSFNYKKP
jgi:predicted nuclease with TOPRIM domain